MLWRERYGAARLWGLGTLGKSQEKSTNQRGGPFKSQNLIDFQIRKRIKNLEISEILIFRLFHFSTFPVFRSFFSSPPAEHLRKSRKISGKVDKSKGGGPFKSQNLIDFQIRKRIKNLEISEILIFRLFHFSTFPVFWSFSPAHPAEDSSRSPAAACTAENQDDRKRGEIQDEAEREQLRDFLQSKGRGF